MHAPSLVLWDPTVERVASYLDFIDELRAHGDQIWPTMFPAAGESAAEFVARVVGAKTSPVPPSVPATTYWAAISGVVVGRGALRHVLTDELVEYGGQISYEVRPSYRRQGVATEMLRQILVAAKVDGLGPLLVTCAPDNVGSNRAIQANGGRLVKTAYVERISRETNYYQVDL